MYARRFQFLAWPGPAWAEAALQLHPPADVQCTLATLHDVLASIFCSVWFIIPTLVQQAACESTLAGRVNASNSSRSGCWELGQDPKITRQGSRGRRPVVELGWPSALFEIVLYMYALGSPAARPQWPSTPRFHAFHGFDFRPAAWAVHHYSLRNLFRIRL